MKQSIIRLVSSFVVLVVLCAPAFADAANGKLVYHEQAFTSEKFVDSKLVNKVSPDTPVPFNAYGETQVTTVLPNTYYTLTVTPSGQPGNGYEGGSGAFVFFFEAEGRSTEFSVKIDSKFVSFTAKTGATSSSGTGYGQGVPSTAGRYRFDFIKNYTISSKRFDVYKYGVYQYSYYSHNPQYSLNHKWVRL